MHNVIPHLANPCPEAQVLLGQLCSTNMTMSCNTWTAALKQDLANPSRQGKAIRRTATLNSRNLRALSFQLFSQQFTESPFFVKSDLSLPPIPYTMCLTITYSWSLGTEMTTLHPTGLVEPSAQFQDRSRVLTALGAGKSILMGRVFEGEDFCMADSQMCLSTNPLFTYVSFHKIQRSAGIMTLP